MSSVFSKRTCWVVKRSGFAYLPCWHWGNMQILVFWSENKPLLMKWDGNIQNVLFCCGRTCLRTSLGNTRHASTLDSQFSQVQRFPSACAFKEIHCTSSSSMIPVSCEFFCSLHLRQKKRTQVLFRFFHYVFVPSRRPRLRTCCTCLCVSVPPHCTGCPSHVVWRCSCLAAVQILSSEKTLSVSCTVGHSASHFMALLLLCCCYLDVLFCKTRISQLSAMTFRTNISQNFLLAKSCRIENTCGVLVQINFPF